MLIDLREKVRERGREEGRKEGRERERERERNINQLPSVHTLTRDQTYNLVLCPDWEPNPQPKFWWMG